MSRGVPRDVPWRVWRWLDVPTSRDVDHTQKSTNRENSLVGRAAGQNFRCRRFESRRNIFFYCFFFIWWDVPWDVPGRPVMVWRGFGWDMSRVPRHLRWCDVAVWCCDVMLWCDDVVLRVNKIYWCVNTKQWRARTIMCSTAKKDHWTEHSQLDIKSMYVAPSDEESQHVSKREDERSWVRLVAVYRSRLGSMSSTYSYFIKVI